MTRGARHRRPELRASAGLKKVSVRRIRELYGQTLNRKGKSRIRSQDAAFHIQFTIV